MTMNLTKLSDRIGLEIIDIRSGNVSITSREDYEYFCARMAKLVRIWDKIQNRLFAY
jgi:hypothetical protein